MPITDDIKTLEQLLDQIDEFNKRDEEAIARAKLEREQWLEEKKNVDQNKIQDWLTVKHLTIKGTLKNMISRVQSLNQ